MRRMLPYLRSLLSRLLRWCPVVRARTYHSVADHLEGENIFLRIALDDQRKKTAEVEALLSDARNISHEKSKAILTLTQKLEETERRCSRLTQVMRGIRIDIDRAQIGADPIGERA